MNISKRLQKIGRDLQEIAMDMDPPEKPKRRKGSYVRIHNSKDNPYDRQSIFIAKLLKNSFRIHKKFFIEFIAEVENSGAKEFWEGNAYWVDDEDGRYWQLIRINNSTVFPRDWNPPRNLK